MRNPALHRGISYFDGATLAMSTAIGCGRETRLWTHSRDMSTQVVAIEIEKYELRQRSAGVVAPVDFINDALQWADQSTRRRIGRDNAAELLGVEIPQ
jgi:hypothetical protein